MFNDFLQQMKDDFIGTRYSAFWDRVVEGTHSLKHYFTRMYST